uniref:CUB domain-containing protein n=1 Tax=Cacopsylla melanoneura TaxID=428564 RepID=A0A8D8TZB1_9HEMI
MKFIKNNKCPGIPGFYRNGIFFYLMAVVCCVTGQQLQTKPPCSHSIEVNALVGRIQSPGYPYPYRSGCEWTYTINVGEYGSEIEIIMQTFDIDQAAGDSLYVATGTIEDNRNWYKIEKTDLEVFVRSPAILKFVTTQHLINTHVGFSIVFRKHDDIDNFGTTTTTTEVAAVTSELNATPCYNNWLLIQLKGLSLAEFQQKKESFQRVMANVTAIYSTELSLNISQILKDIGYDKLILINSVDNCKQCFIYKDKCIQVNISINSNNIGFEEIRQIWNLYKDCYLFRSIGIEEHTSSDVQMDGLIITWLVASVLLAITVVILLCMLSKNKRIFTYITWFHMKSKTGSKDQDIMFPATSAHCDNFQPYLPNYSHYVKPNKKKKNRKSKSSDQGVTMSNDEIDFDAMLYSLEMYNPNLRFSPIQGPMDVHTMNKSSLPPSSATLPRVDPPNDKLRRYSTKEFF